MQGIEGSDKVKASKDKYGRFELLIPLAITSKDLEGLGAVAGPISSKWEYQDILDDDARSFVEFAFSGQKVPAYRALKDLETSSRCTVVAIVDEQPRITGYVGRSGEPAKFASIWVRDASGAREMILWDLGDVAMVEAGGVKKGSIMLVLGARLASGKQGPYVSTSDPHVIKIDPPGFKAKHFEAQGSGAEDITALCDLEQCVGFLVSVSGVVTDKGKTSVFNRKSGGQGRVSHARIFDSTASANITFWDDAAVAIEAKELGAQVTATALRVRQEAAGLVLHSTSATRVL